MKHITMEKEQFIRTLKKVLHKNDIKISTQKIFPLYLYYKQLLIWNKKINLISKKQENNFIERHLVDSLWVLKILHTKENDKILDLGSGNGLPGIPLAVSVPFVKIFLLESNKKKCVFLNHVKSILSLKNVTVLCERFEKVHSVLQELDYVLIRGKKLLDKEKGLIMEKLKKQGKIIIYAGDRTLIPPLGPGERLESFLTMGKRKIITIGKF